MDDGWIVIPNWEKFQSRRDRHDPWLKDWIDQLDRDEHLALTASERGIIADMRRAFARFDGQITLLHFTRITYLRPLQKQVERLCDAGLLVVSAAKPPPLGRSRGRERSREEEKNKKKKGSASTNTQKPETPATTNMPPRNEAAYVRKLVENHVITEPFELDAYQLDNALRDELKALL